MQPSRPCSRAAPPQEETRPPAPMPGVPMLLGHPVDSKPASQGSLTLETVTVKGARDPGLATSSCLSKTLPRSPSGRASPGK